MRTGMSPAVVLLMSLVISCAASVNEPVDEETFTPDTVVNDTAGNESTLPEIDTVGDDADDADPFMSEDDALPDEGASGEDDLPAVDDAVTFDEDEVFVPDSDATSTCWEPEVLIAIDRTLSMRTAVDGVTKWDMARQAIAAIGEKFSSGIFFGLEFFPKTVEGCYTIADIQAGNTVNNVTCLEGEVIIPPAYDTDELINSTMESAKLCRSSPIKSALLSARDFYVAHPPTPAERKQFVILLTDGKETCEKATLSCGAQELLAAGVKTYVVGFGGAVNPDYLNHLVCAGGTAPDPNACLVGPTSGCTEAYLGIDPLYFTAEDGDQLLLQLDEIAAKLAECQS